MNYRTVIVEGTLNAHNFLQKCIDKMAPKLTVVGVGKSVSFSARLINNVLPDVIFIGDTLVDGRGIDVLLGLKDNVDASIFYVCSPNRSFEYHFKRKVCFFEPYDIAGFKFAVNKKLNIVVEKNELGRSNLSTSSNYIGISSISQFEIHSFNEIIYLEANRRYTTFHLVNGASKTASVSLGEYEKKLCDLLFFRIHNSYMVNIRFLEHIYEDGHCTMFSNVRLPISRRRRKKFNQFISG